MPLCNVPCDNVIAPKAAQMFKLTGDGVAASDKFELPARNETTIRVRAGSSSRRGGGIAMVTIGSVATVLGLTAVGVGAWCSEIGHSCAIDSSGALIGGGVSSLIGVGLIIGGAVLASQGKTTFEFINTKEGASVPPALFRF